MPATMTVTESGTKFGSKRKEQFPSSPSVKLLEKTEAENLQRSHPEEEALLSLKFDRMSFS